MLHAACDYIETLKKELEAWQRAYTGEQVTRQYWEDVCMCACPEELRPALQRAAAQVYSLSYVQQ